MKYIIYNSSTGLIVGGPLTNQADADRIAGTGESVLAVTEKHIDRKTKRVSGSLKLRNWTQSEKDSDTATELESKTKINKIINRSRNNHLKGIPQNIPAMKKALDDIYEIMSRNGLLVDE
jgi:hypothetical protein